LNEECLVDRLKSCGSKRKWDVQENYIAKVYISLQKIVSLNFQKNTIELCVIDVFICEIEVWFIVRESSIMIFQLENDKLKNFYIF